MSLGSKPSSRQDVVFLVSILIKKDVTKDEPEVDEESVVLKSFRGQLS